MAVLLSTLPSASRSHRAQPARLRRAPRASRVAFGSAERGCAPAGSPLGSCLSQGKPPPPGASPRLLPSQKRGIIPRFSHLKRPPRPPRPGTKSGRQRRKTAPPPVCKKSGTTAQPARLRRAPRASRVAFGSAERGCAPAVSPSAPAFPKGAAPHILGRPIKSRAGAEDHSGPAIRFSFMPAAPSFHPAG